MASSRRWLTLTAFVALIAGAGGVSAGILITSPPPGLASRTHLPHRRAHHGPPGSTGNSHHVRFHSLRD